MNMEMWMSNLIEMLCEKISSEIIVFHRALDVSTNPLESAKFCKISELMLSYRAVGLQRLAWDLDCLGIFPNWEWRL